MEGEGAGEEEEGGGVSSGVGGEDGEDLWGESERVLEN